MPESELPTTKLLLPPGLGGCQRWQSSSSDSVTGILVLSSLVAVTGSYVFGAVLGYSSPAQAEIVADLGLSLAESSWFGSIPNLGAMVGAALSGKTADLFGRRGAMGFAELFNVAGWLLIAFAKNAWWLDIGRLLTGFGIGILSYVVPVYVAEITPRNVRGVFCSLNQLMVCLGISVTYLIGNVTNWRLLALIGTVPCLLQLVGLFFIPESPRFLAKLGYWEGCMASLVRLRGQNTDISEEADDIIDYTKTLEQFEDTRILDLFERRYVHALIVAVGLMVFQQFGGINAISFYASNIFESAGYSRRLGTTTLAIVPVPFSILGIILVDKSGRRPLLVASASGACFGCFLIGLSFILQERNLWDFSPSLALAGVLIFMGSVNAGLAGIPWVIVSEILPINVKGRAGSLVAVIKWFSSWIVTYSFNFLFEWSSEGTFFMFSAISGFTIIFVLSLVPETKGRSLEEIQASLISL